MSPELRIDLTSGTPADQQIRDQVAGHVLAGTLPGGHRVTTVRRLARDLRLNTDTVARAYRDLESDRLLVRCRRIWLVRPPTPPDAHPDPDPAGPARPRLDPLAETTTIAVISARVPGGSPPVSALDEVWARPGTTSA